jgi:biotin carboxylase
MKTFIRIPTPKSIQNCIIAKHIVVQYGERGYYIAPAGYTFSCNDEDVAESIAEASMFGWDTPSANLANEWVQDQLKRLELNKQLAGELSKKLGW